MADSKKKYEFGGQTRFENDLAMARDHYQRLTKRAKRDATEEKLYSLASKARYGDPKAVASYVKAFNALPVKKQAHF